MQKLMKDTEAPEDVLTELLRWFTGYEINILHCWKTEFTWLFVVVSEDYHADTQTMYFMRLWRNAFNGRVSMSQDKSLNVSLMAELND